MTAEFWQYDARIGRRWNVDPKPNVSISPYAAFENNGIFNSDPLGDTTRPTTYQSSWSNNADNLKYKESGKYGDHRKKFNLGAGEEMYKVNCTYIFERDNYDNGKNDFWFYNGDTWEGFTPEVRPKMPRNVAKLLFWDAAVQSISPIDDFDIYVSASVKTKANGGDLGLKVNNASATLVMFGVQAGFTSKDGQGGYADLVTPANSYLSYKFGTTEVRGLPFGSMVKIPLGGTMMPKYGDFSPQLRVIQDIQPYKGITLQGERGMGLQKVTVGGRGKLEYAIGPSGMSVDATGGVRLDLKIPSLFKALWEQF